MNTVPLPAPLALEPAALSPVEAGAVLGGALVAEPAVSVLDVDGSGATSCLQGLLTCDIEKPGEGAFLYGAILTPKGMIVSDLWTVREGGRVELRVPRSGGTALREVLTRSLPPRLARVRDASEERVVLRMVGPTALEAAAAAGIALPPEGRVATAVIANAAVTIARPSGRAPFGLEITTAAEHGAALRARLNDAGASTGSSAALELARILAGWPALGAEIDERTLPQEVLLDELGGVSYTKGCYVGQETVARLHFRGHANRYLRGLIWEDRPAAGTADISQDEMSRGRVTSFAWVPALDRWLGLGILRREVDAERPVIACRQPAVVASLPFTLDA
jgi:tRNA-modifying protein YgfZ